MNLVIGIVLILLWRQLRVEGVRSKRSLSNTTDLGQKPIHPDRGFPDNITHEEIQWAYEQGAESDSEVLDMITNHKQEESR